MELIVLDTSLKMLSVLDTFESLIWTERYSAYGDFEVYTSINDSILEILKDDYYLWLKESDQTMIVEDRKIESDAENGNHFTVTGRSLESILERRIIWKQTILSGNFQNGIKKLLDENIINPSDASRKVERLIFEASTDPAITGLTVDAQFTGDNLYDAIKKLCDSKNIGFRIKLSDDNKFVFKLYAGADRSYDQFTNAYWKQLWATWFNEYTNNNTSEMAAWRENAQALFDEWFQQLKDTLSENVEANLANQILELQERTKILEEIVEGIRTEFTVYNKLYDNGYENHDKLLDSSDGTIIDSDIDPIVARAYSSSLILDSNGQPIDGRVIFCIR